ncbi:inactive serine/threonine-protein kinase PLK5 isoform 2-T2 [Thomomys bottae]
MEPASRRRRRSRQLVATFLRDPSSGRVYRRGKLIGKLLRRLRSEDPGSKSAEGRKVSETVVSKSLPEELDAEMWVKGPSKRPAQGLRPGPEFKPQARHHAQEALAQGWRRPGASEDRNPSPAGRLQPLLQANGHVHQRRVRPQSSAARRGRERGRSAARSGEGTAPPAPPPHVPREPSPLLPAGVGARCMRCADGPGEGGSLRVGWSPQVEREIALHSRLRHRNIVAFHGHFADRDHVYMVLEYCSRQSLAHVLKARQTLTEPEVRYYLRGLVSGLRYMHQRRIVHRDLKLSNFFLNKNMEVKIGDLGLATKVGPGGHCHRVLCGTPNFLAPEVVSRKGHSCQSDIWALGCVMYTVLTGTPPFTGTPLSEMYQNIRDGHYPEPAHVSPNACRLIARLLAPNPAERPSLDHLLQEDFFTQGFTPERLPPHSCHSPPIFTFPLPLGRLFRKMGQMLVTQCRPPCPFTLNTASGPGEEGPEPESMEWGSEASLSVRTAPCPEAPVHFLTQGALRSDLAGSGKSSRQEVEAAIRKLQLCLEPGLMATQAPPGEQRPILWAPKWVDYSSKYGFAYQLSDGGSGVLFRDGTHMALRPPGSQICYLPSQRELQTFTPRAVPGPLRAKLAVLRLFACYMQRRLREEGAPSASAPPAPPGLCLLRFLSTPDLLLLLLSDGTVQVSFGRAQAQLVVSGEGEGLLLSQLEPGQPRTCYSLKTLWNDGCDPGLHRRLHLALRLLQSI